METVFISWSGDKSRSLAHEVQKWLPNVLQALDVFISTDISKGATWLSEITSALKDSKFGIVCITSENARNPWLNFEAGALFNRFDKAHVQTLLFDIQKSDVENPLGIFQHTSFDKDDCLKLVKTINALLENPLDESRLSHAFDRCWNDFERACSEILTNSGEGKAGIKPRREDREILDEILEILRSKYQKEPSLSFDDFFSKNDFDLYKNAAIVNQRASAAKRFIEAMEGVRSPSLKVTANPTRAKINSSKEIVSFIDQASEDQLVDFLRNSGISYALIAEAIKESDKSKVTVRNQKLRKALIAHIEGDSSEEI